ncbi:MAG: arylamine N-acetyltransferase, partial [Firmicutes bacterium]|nr:arylamine N-acetyltransferase [Bacillota bacterium]
DDGDCCYEMTRDNFRGWIQNQKTAEGWRQQLSFKESPQIDLDFVTPTYFAQHHPDSKINKFTKVSLHKDGEFYAIREGIFLTEKHGVVRDLEEMQDPARETELIRDFFGINI